MPRSPRRPPRAPFAKLATAGFGLAVAGLAMSCGGSRGGGFASTAAAVGSASPAPTTSPTQPAPPVRRAPENLRTGPEVVLDASGQHAFFDLPWPSDARTKPGGGPDLSGLPNPRSKDFITKTAEVCEQDTVGFSPTCTVYLRFDAPVHAPPADPLQTVAPDAQVFLVDIDPASPHRLERRPFLAQVTTAADRTRPAHLLQLLPVPGLGLRPGTTYAAVVLRGLGAPSGPWLGQPPLLTDLLAGRAPPGPLGARLAQAHAPLAPALRDLGVHPDDVAAATVFTTGDPAAELTSWVDWALAQPPAQPTALRTRDVYPGFTALVGELPVAMYQRGTPPFAFGGGEIRVDAAGRPLPQGTAQAEFQLSIPRGVMPAAGFPLYFYVHGTGGLASQAIDRGRWTAVGVEPARGSGLAQTVAPLGWATSCLAGHNGPGRIGLLSADGYANYNFMNPRAMRDNFRQMILEQVAFLRALEALRIDPALCPGTDASAAPDGKVRFDPRLRVVGGQSLGSYLSGMLAALVPGWTGAVLTGAGGSWIEFAFGPKDPIDLQLAIEVLAVPPGERLDRFHPLIMAFNQAAGPADNTHYVRRVLREPRPGHVPPHVLVVEGHVDLQVPSNIQRPLLLALGVDLAGPDVGRTQDEQVAHWLPWGGRGQVPYPQRENLTLPDGTRRTAVSVRYLEDGIREGHHVWMQLPQAQRQIGDFVADLAAGRAPTVAQ